MPVRPPRATVLLTLSVAAAVTLVATPAGAADPKVDATVADVASGPSMAFGEAVTTGWAGGSVLAATAMAAEPVHVQAWWHAKPAAAWAGPAPVVPDGFTRSYDPSATTLPDGTALLVVGTAAGGTGSCLSGGSVAISRLPPNGAAPSAPSLVDDTRSSDGFDDRPVVLAGSDSTVWVAWSHGQTPDVCAVVGPSDVIEVAVSHDGGRTFSLPTVLPRLSAGAAFGAQLAPLPGGRALLSWSELSGGSVRIMTATLDRHGRASPPALVATDQALPLVLPAASFYSYSLASAATLPDGRIALAWPAYDHDEDHSVLRVALSTVQDRWSITTLPGNVGVDPLLPALATTHDGDLRLLYAAHDRHTDAIGYFTQRLTATRRGVTPTGPVQTVSPALPGPGFSELGEFLSLTSTDAGLLGAVVTGGRDHSVVQLVRWDTPPPAAAQTPTSRTAGLAPSRDVISLSAGLGGLGVLLAAGVAVLLASRRRRQGFEHVERWPAPDAETVVRARDP